VLHVGQNDFKQYSTYGKWRLLQYKNWNLCLQKAHYKYKYISCYTKTAATKKLRNLNKTSVSTVRAMSIKTILQHVYSGVLPIRFYTTVSRTDSVSVQISRFSYHAHRFHLIIVRFMYLGTLLSSGKMCEHFRRRCCVHRPEAAGATGMLVSTYQTTQCHNPADSSLHRHRRGNPESQANISHALNDSLNYAWHYGYW
jgi:hypothetical protein